MTQEQFKAEKSYLISLSIIKALKSNNIITDKEFDAADKALLERYRPVASSFIHSRGT